MAKRTSLVFEDENLLRGVREQAIVAGTTMNQYIQDLIRDDLRDKVGCKIVKHYSDGTTDETDLWSKYDATNEAYKCQQLINEPSFTEDGQTPLLRRLESWELYEKGEKIGESV